MLGFFEKRKTADKLLTPFIEYEVITGGGFHGKSTLLNAISTGCYDKKPGDGREFVVSISESACIRAEDGRSVSNVDISAFIGRMLYHLQLFY